MSTTKINPPSPASGVVKCPPLGGASGSQATAPCPDTTSGQTQNLADVANKAASQAALAAAASIDTGTLAATAQAAQLQAAKVQAALKAQMGAPGRPS